jgi:hypothetical protein
VSDGCYARDDADADATAATGAVRSWPTPGLDEAHLQRVVERLHVDLADEPAPVDDATIACLQLSLPGPVLHALAELPPPQGPMTTSAFGMSLRAATPTRAIGRAYDAVPVFWHAFS